MAGASAGSSGSATAEEAAFEPLPTDVAASGAPAQPRRDGTAAVTRLNPNGPRREAGPGVEQRRPQAQAAGLGQARPRAVGLQGGPRPAGQPGPRRPQPAAVVTVVPTGESAAAAVPERRPRPAQATNPADSAALTRVSNLVKSLDQDEYSDAVPLPSRRPRLLPAAKPARVDAFATYVPGPTAMPAKMRQRHWGLVAFFCLMVVFPAIANGWYLYTRAADQYESNVGFGSRTEDTPSTFAFLGALGGAGASSSKDMDILNQFISSQEIVARVDKKLDLRAIFSKPANDPIFSFPKDGPVEDLVTYWQKMVLPNYDSGTGLMSLRVFAFDPKDAQNIAQAVLDESTSIINELSTTAQTDTTKYSEETLRKAEERMASAQQSLTDFRIKNRIVDPQSQLAGASQVVNSLVQQLGTAEIDLDMLTGTVPASDPRIAQLNRRIDVIQKRMDEENSKVGGLADPNAAGYAKLVVDYQNLQMEQDFAQKAYLTALSAYDQAVNDAQHKTRYLTTYLSPTLAESSTAPSRPLRIFMTVLAGFLAWASIVMIYYALRDRR